MTVYEVLGAEVGIRKAVDLFFDRVLAAPELSGYFAGVEMSRLRRHQVAMLSAATGGPVAYTGREMAAAHAGKGITEDAFGRVVGHLVEALKSLGVDADTIQQVVNALAPLQPSIVSA